MGNQGRNEAKSNGWLPASINKWDQPMTPCLAKWLQQIGIAMFLIMRVETVLAAERMAVAAPKAMVLAGPGVQFDKVWEAKKYSPLLVLKKEGTWCQVQDHEGDKGWVSLSSLSKTDTVITIKKECVVRSGPGTTFKQITVIGSGIAFKVLERKGNWIYVEHADADRGWLHKSVFW
jgi:uncharacterized protein YgiM (DUF1202 family)